MTKQISFTAAFKRDYKRVSKRGKDINKLKSIVSILCEDLPLPVSARDHALTGNWAGFRELHIEPDWLLIYTNDIDGVIVYRTGTHSDLFG